MFMSPLGLLVCVYVCTFQCMDIFITVGGACACKGVLLVSNPPRCGHLRYYYLGMYKNVCERVMGVHTGTLSCVFAQVKANVYVHNRVLFFSCVCLLVILSHGY